MQVPDPSRRFRRPPTSASGLKIESHPRRPIPPSLGAFAGTRTGASCGSDAAGWARKDESCLVFQKSHGGVWLWRVGWHQSLILVVSIQIPCIKHLGILTWSRWKSRRFLRSPSPAPRSDVRRLGSDQAEVGEVLCHKIYHRVLG